MYIPVKSEFKQLYTNMMSYPGEIVDNTFCFQELKYKDSRGKTRVFRLFVRLVKTERVETEANWNVLNDAVLKFYPEYLSSKQLPDCAVQYWSEYGELDGKIVRAAPKYTEFKNLGKKNERNPLIQAMETCLSLYRKKKNDNVKLEIPQEAANPMVFLMLAVEKKDPSQYPVFGQLKLDGHRCAAFINKHDEVVLYTRGLKLWPDSPAVDRVRAALKPALMELRRAGRKSLYLDGEFYIHGIHLQDVSGMRSESYDGPIEYHIFDSFDTLKEEPFEERWKRLEECKAIEGPLLQLVETKILKSEAEEDAFYKAALTRNYEGIMLRDPAAPYKYSLHKQSSRSKGLLKRKPLPDAEFEVVGFTDGKGKDAGAVVWICQTSSGKEFHVQPKGITNVERRTLYQDCLKNFRKKYHGRLLKVEYRALSKDCIPLRAKAIDFRDFE